MARSEKQIVTCYICAKAYLMRDMQNPIIAGCKVTHEREVAETPHVCEHYKENKQPIVIHPMIFAK